MPRERAVSLQLLGLCRARSGFRTTVYSLTRAPLLPRGLARLVPGVRQRWASYIRPYPPSCSPWCGIDTMLEFKERALLLAPTSHATKLPPKTKLQHCHVNTVFDYQFSLFFYELLWYSPRSVFDRPRNALNCYELCSCLLCYRLTNSYRKQIVDSTSNSRAKSSMQSGSGLST